MLKKTFIRLTLFCMVMTVGLMVITAAKSRQQAAAAAACTGSAEECPKKTQSEFNIWETLSRTIMSTSQY